MQTFNYQALPVEPESVSNVTTTNSVDLGTIRTVNGEEYVYVYNGGTASAPVGKCMVLSFSSGYTLTVSSTTGYDVAFGVVKHAAIPASAYGWLLTRGFSQVQNAMQSTAMTAGDLLVPAAAGGAQNLNVSTTALCGNVGMIGVPAFGYVVSGCASGASANSTVLAYVRTWGS